MNPITFSTLACPQWQIETVIAKAKEYGYGGVEWRGGAQGHLQFDMPDAKKKLLLKSCSDAGLISLAITTYTSFVSDSLKDRQANIDVLRHYSDLAAEIGAIYVRAFLGELPSETKPDTFVYEKISDCLNTASEYADTVGVKIAVEPHDTFVRSADVVPIFRKPRSHQGLGVIWDIGNAFAAGEDPEEGFDLLKDYLMYIQVKDGIRSASNWQLCPLGTGDVPLRKVFELLQSNDYQGAISVEWEYAWHPELDPPEIALPSALRTVHKLLASTQTESV